MQSGGLQMSVVCLVIEEFYKGCSATNGDTTSGLLLLGANINLKNQLFLYN